jgi:hypothetical protein
MTPTEREQELQLTSNIEAAAVELFQRCDNEDENNHESVPGRLDLVKNLSGWCFELSQIYMKDILSHVGGTDAS